MEKNQHIRNILVAVDVQNDFIDGSLAVTEGAQVVEPLNDVAKAVRASDGTALFTRDWHPASTPHFETWPVHCVAGTEGADFHPDLDVQGNDIVINKGMEQTDGYSGWEGIGAGEETLETLITPRTPEEKVQVFVGGLATDYCVKATTLDIAKHFKDDSRVDLYLLRDAIRAVGLEVTDEARALKAIEDANVQAITSLEARHIIQGTVS